MATVKVTVKWNKEKFENVEINLSEPVRASRLPGPAERINGWLRTTAAANQPLIDRFSRKSQVAVFKAQLFSLSAVPPERQKVMGVKGAAQAYSLVVSAIVVNCSTRPDSCAPAGQAAF